MDKPIRRYGATEPERFWEKVRKTDTCWEWTGALQNGYGVFRFQGAARIAHRISWLWASGPIPEGMEVDHTCFNHGCVNPAHLRLLDHTSNGQNRASANKNSKSGIRGVYKPSGSDYWLARAQKDRKVHFIGSFATAEDAEAAAIAWRREHMPHSVNDMERSNA